MSRRRLINSYFYVMYNNQRVKKGGTVTLSPFEATGGTDSFTVHSSKDWIMGQKPSWLTTSVEGGDRGVTTVTVSAAANTDDARNGSTNIGPVYFLDNHYITIAYSQNSSSVDYRNLTVSPVSMYLTTSDVETGQAIHAYVDVYINGTFDHNEEVTNLVEWSSYDTDVANCYRTSGGEVVKPNYDPTRYHPATSTTVQARYLNSAATCNVNVAAEGRIEYELVVSPVTATIDSNGSTSLTVTLQAYVDGQRDSSQDRTVTTSANYSTHSNLITVDSSGNVTGTEQEVGGDAIITVTHADVPSQSVNVTIHVNDAVVVEYLDIIPGTASTTWNGTVSYTVYYVKEVNGNETEREQVALEYLNFTLQNENVGRMVGLDFIAENISTNQATEEISATCVGGTHSGVSSVTPATLVISGASSVEIELAVNTNPTYIGWSGTSYLTATAITRVNGNVYDSHPAADVVWSENSQGITISGNTVYGNNLEMSIITATITGYSQEIDRSGTTAVTVGTRPMAMINVWTPETPSHVSSGAGSCVYYIEWSHLLPGTEIGLMSPVYYHGVLDSFSPTSIPITDSNSLAGSATVIGYYSENPYANWRGLELWASGVPSYSYQSEVFASAFWLQEPAPAVLLINGSANTTWSHDYTAINNEVFDVNARGIEWSSIAIGTYGGCLSSAELTNNKSGLTISAPQNDSYSDITGYATVTGRSLDGYSSFTATLDVEQLGHHSYTYAFVIAPLLLDSQPYSGSHQYMAIFQTYVDGTHDPNLDRDVTSASSWTIGTNGGTFSVSDVENGLASWVNLYTGATEPNVNVTATYVKDGQTYYYTDTFSVENLTSLNATLDVIPNTTTVAYGGSVDYAMHLNIYHNGDSVYEKLYNTNSTYDGQFYLSSNAAQYEKHGNLTFENNNYGNSPITATLAGEFEEDSSLYLPPTMVVNGTATATLLEQAAPPQTYSVTFVCFPTAEEIQYRINNGAPTTIINVSTQTIIGLDNGDTISYTASTGGYYDVIGTETINGADLTINITFRPRTYNVTFICSPYADSVSYYVPSQGRSGSNHGVSRWTVSGFSDGSIVSYIGQKTDYYDIRSSGTINGADLYVYMTFSGKPTTDVTLSATKETNNNTTYYTVSATLKATDNSWQSQATVQTSKIDNSAVTVTFRIPESKSAKTFTYLFSQNGSTSYDYANFDRPPVFLSESSLSGLTYALSRSAFTPSVISNARLKIGRCYTITGEITLNAEHIASSYISLSIYPKDGPNIVTFVAPPEYSHGDVTSSYQYNKCVATDTLQVFIGGAILDGAKYQNFNLQVYPTRYTSTPIYSGPVSRLVEDAGGQGLTFTYNTLNGSYWKLSSI